MSVRPDECNGDQTQLRHHVVLAAASKRRSQFGRQRHFRFHPDPEAMGTVNEHVDTAALGTNEPR